MLEVRELTVAAIYVVLSVLQKLDLHFRNKTSILDAYIELDRSVAFGTFTKAVREMEIEISNVQFVHMEMEDGDIAFTVTFKRKNKFQHDVLLRLLSRLDGVRYIEEL